MTKEAKAEKIASMTGFGRGSAGTGGLVVDVELSSVNRKQLDMRLNMPRSMASLEAGVHNLIRAKIVRGSVTGTIRADAQGEARAGGIHVDVDIARAYARKFRAMGSRLGMPGDVSIETLAALPGVVRFEALPDNPDALWPAVRQAVGGAVAELVRMRLREGAALAADLGKRLSRLARLRDRIERRAPLVPRRSARMLRERLRALGAPVPMDDPIVLREVAILADRSDITEELTRLQSHLVQAADLLATGGVVGRTLDFLCQEMFREINTAGSKAGDATIARLVIEFKSGLEAVREQVQNIE